MRVKTVLVLIIFLAGTCLAVTTVSTDFNSRVSEIEKKETATYGDALFLFSSLQGRKVSLEYGEGEPLTRGMASLMAAEYLDLSGSLLFNIFGTERYAYRACVAGGLMSPEGSENDLISGPELLELLARISMVEGG